MGSITQLRMFVGRDIALRADGSFSTLGAQSVDSYENIRQLSAEERKKFFKAGFAALGISE